VLPSFNKQSRVFYGNSRDFGGTNIIYHGPAATTTTILRRWQGVATHGPHRSNVSSAASSSEAEPVDKEEASSPPWQRQRQTSPASSWVERWLPTAARPYAMLARLHKPDAIWFYAWPCIWLQPFIPLLVGGDQTGFVKKRYLAGWKATLLNRAARLVLAASVLSSLPLHYMSALIIPKTVIKAVDRRQRAFFWTGEDKCHGSKCLIAWEHVCKAKNQGGLGLKDLETQNHCLLLKFVDKIMGDSPAPWKDWIIRNTITEDGLSTSSPPSFLWSIAIAAKEAELPDLKMVVLFGFGSVVLRGAACTVNDLLDRDIDKKVERTKHRPLASGAITLSQGFSFLVFQVLLWFGFLLQLNNRSLIMGASWLVLFFTYPLMKRLTYWPQAYLGFTINFGVFLASAAIKENLDYAVILPMYFAGICWTLVYDTIYAHQDKKDDLKAGVKSTAIRFGDNTKYWLSGFGVACISSLAFTGYNAHLAWAYYPFLAAAAGHLAVAGFYRRLIQQIRLFVSNKWFGAFVFGGILFGMLAS
ncbi:hypothetical protein U9M48_034947, partial [Paspalum notatum var. saurae]